MFDANMRHLKKGTRFFASCHGIEENNVDFKVGEVYLCYMMEDGDKNPKVWFKAGGRLGIRMRSDDLFYDRLFLYEGQEDLTDFINDEMLKKAKLVLEEMI